MSDARIVPVVLSGGSGTRLWPLSTEERPKQLLALTGAATMLQATVARVRDERRFAPPVIVAGERHADEIEAQLAAAGLPLARLILEPCARNTAPAIALAALLAEPDDVLLVMPSDHLIRDQAAFMAAIKAALPLARDGWIATFGIRPDRPETGYGYIRRGEALSPGVFRAVQFVEKPDAATAAAYLAEGRYDWNGGIFLFRACNLLDELRRLEPETADAVAEAVARAKVAGSRTRPDAGNFARATSRSIDHAVMEHAARVAVVPVAMGWSDVGSWDALYDIGEPDGEGNVAGRGSAAINSRGCLLRSDGPTIAAVGVDDLIIVATAEAVLVTRRGNSQGVKDAAAAVRRNTVGQAR